MHKFLKFIFHGKFHPDPARCQAVRKTCMTYTIAVCTAKKNSW